MDPEKLDTIHHWVLPTTKEGILKFAGFVNYLRNFIPNASHLLAPFYALLDQKKHPKFPSKEVIVASTTAAFLELKVG